MKYIILNDAVFHESPGLLAKIDEKQNVAFLKPFRHGAEEKEDESYKTISITFSELNRLWQEVEKIGKEDLPF